MTRIVVWLKREPLTAWAAVVAAFTAVLAGAGVGSRVVVIVSGVLNVAILLAGRGVVTPMVSARRLGALLSAPLLHDPAIKRLGLVKGFDPSSVRVAGPMARYLRVSKLPPIPANPDYSAVAAWLLWLNDKLGDCTIESWLHGVTACLARAGRKIPTFTKPQVQAGYSGACGYNPKDPSTDQGGDPAKVLAYLQSTGVAGHKADAAVTVNLANAKEVRTAIELFGGIWLALDLHVAQQRQKVWDYVPGSGEWGGHMTWLIAPRKIVTWNEVVGCTSRFLAKQAIVGYAIVNVDLLNANGVSPDGLDLAQLRADVQLVAA